MKMNVSKFVAFLETRIFPEADGAVLDSTGYWDVLKYCGDDLVVLASGEVEVKWSDPGWEGTVTL
jgi:hypothetical protein